MESGLNPETNKFFVRYSVEGSRLTTVSIDSLVLPFKTPYELLGSQDLIPPKGPLKGRGLLPPMACWMSKTGAAELCLGCEESSSSPYRGGGTRVLVLWSGAGIVELARAQGCTHLDLLLAHPSSADGTPVKKIPFFCLQPGFFVVQ
jgi:hypothetical protein